MRKYNPYLKGMVDNYRNKLASINVQHQHLTDEQLYIIIDRNAGCSTSDEQYEQVVEDVKITLDNQKQNM